MVLENKVVKEEEEYVLSESSTSDQKLGMANETVKEEKEVGYGY